jgi:hypothetical protein
MFFTKNAARKWRHFLWGNCGAVNIYLPLCFGSGYPLQALRNHCRGLQPPPGLLRSFHSYPAAIGQLIIAGLLFCEVILFLRFESNKLPRANASQTDRNE